MAGFTVTRRGFQQDHGYFEPQTVAPTINVLDPRNGAKGDGVTDDTGAVQTAINRATALATSSQIVDVWLPSGYGFFLGRIVAKNGVRLVCDGATILPNWTSIGAHVFITGTASTPLNRFGIRGGFWQGTGSETVHQQLFSLAGSDGSGTTITHSRFTGMEVTNWNTGVLNLTDPFRVMVDHCVMDTCTVCGGFNAISFAEITDNANIGQVIATSNIITNNGAGSVTYTKAVGTATRDVQAIFADNIVSGTSDTSNSLNGGLDVECQDSGGTLLGILMHGNHVNSVANNSWAVNIGNVSQGTIHAKVIGNRIEGSSTGSVGVHIGATASTADVQNNTILTPNITGGSGTPFKSGNRYVEGSVMSGRAAMTSGAVTVNTTEVKASDNILLSRVISSGTSGAVSINSISAGTSFDIHSTSGADAGTVYWKIDH